MSECGVFPTAKVGTATKRAKNPSDVPCWLVHFALRPQKRGGLLGTGTGEGGVGGGGGGEDERVKARPRIPPEKDRRDRGPPPEQWKC